MSARGSQKPKAKPKTKSLRAGLQFPVGRMKRLLKKGLYAMQIELELVQLSTWQVY